MIAEGTCGAPALSGDGRTVVFNQLVGGDLEIFRWQDGKTDQLTDNDVPDMHPSVSDDGRVVAWTRKPAPGATWDVVQWRDGVESVVADGPGNELSPEVSGDGSTIAFDDDHDGRWSNWDVRAWRNGRLEDVTTRPGDQEFPVVNRDGSRIFWRDFTKDQPDIWMRDQRGVNKPIVGTDTHQGPFAVTADGETIVWSDTRDGETDLLRRDRATVTPVANLREVDESTPSISADGRTIAYQSMDFRKGSPADAQIFLNEDGQKLQVTMSSDGLNVLPSLSDDGKVLTWLWIDSEDTDHRRIYRLER